MAKIETTFIRPKELYTPETGETKVVYDGYQNNPHELVVEENLEGEVSEIVNDTFVPNEGGNVMFTDGSDVEHELITKSGLGKAQVIETTWQALKDLRDNSQLIAGSLYRITDYNCTTKQADTQSAGHQFDIVLLALSENKLAEEGWAMKHPTDVYDVTFDDEVTVKCYFYPYGIDMANIVSTETKLGCAFALDELVVDNEKKTIFIEGYDSFCLEQPITYNYFQNSKLEAWKVWYCLDNDKSRFAWADDSVDEDIPESIITSDNDFSFYRDASQDIGDLYAWASEYTGTHYTENEIPSIGDPVFDSDGEPYKNGEVTLYTPAHEGTGLPNGRGVIYRLIDEWNNDVPYDFKNVLYLRKVTDGEIDAQGTDTYIPTFCLYDIGNDEYKDASIFAIEYPDDEGKARPCNNIFIGSILAIDRSMDSGIYALPQNIILAKVEEDDTGWSSRDITLVNVFMCNFTNSTSHVIYLSSSNKTYVGDNNTIISQGKRVVWENIS